MKAKLFIKGMQEPIVLDYEEARIIERLKSDYSKDPQTAVSIPGVWTGTKGDIRYVLFTKDDSGRQFYRKEIPAMSKFEADDFEKKHRLPSEAECRERGLGTFHWPSVCLSRMGAIRIDEYETPKGRKGVDVVVVKPELYELGTEKIIAYQKTVAPREFAKMKETQALAEMAEQLTSEMAI